MRRYLLFLVLLLFAACSFDYGNQDETDKSQPDIVMDNVEYVRVRSGDPQARFTAERAARYEERQIMELQSLSFEQFEKQTGDVNAFGKAGSAEVMIESGDVTLADGVRIEVESEDISIETKQLQWKDKDRKLSGAAEEAVNIYRANGTTFTGIGFIADARTRTWEFTGGAGGNYIHDDDDEETGETKPDDRDEPPYPEGTKPQDTGK